MREQNVVIFIDEDDVDTSRRWLVEDRSELIGWCSGASWLLNLCCVRTEKGSWACEKKGGKEVNFSWFCAEVFYDRP